MAKVKIDFKQVLLQHGERIGLIVAGVVSLLLLVTALFLPGHGLFAGSASEKAKAIDDTTKWVEERLNNPNNKPGPNDLPGEAKLIDYRSDKVNGSDYRVMPVIPSDVAPNQGRRVPRLYNVEEALADASTVNLRTYIFDRNEPPRILLLVGGSGDKPAGPGGGAPAGPMGPKIGRGFMAGSGAYRNMGGMMGGRGGMMGGRPAFGGLVQGENEKKDLKGVFVDLTDVDKQTDKTPAEQVWPLHVAVIAGSFPYKKQVEEFRSALSLRSNSEVLSERSAKSDPKDTKEAPPSFRFKRVEVERRELDGDGKPITEWMDPKLGDSYRPFLVLTGRRFEKEDPALAPVMFDGLVMRKLQQFIDDTKNSEKGAGGPAMAGPGGLPVGGPPGPGGLRPGDKPNTEGRSSAAQQKDKYPAIEKRLPLIQKTLAALKDKGTETVVATPSRFSDTDFDPFAGDQGTGGTDRPGMGAVPGVPPVKPPTDPSAGGKPAEGEVADYCLVRLIDVTVQPGHTYEYRLRIVMANPNYGRRDASNVAYTEKAELFSDWSTMPIVAQVGTDLFYYAVDQKELQKGRDDEDDKKLYRGPHANENINKAENVVLQAHRWIGITRLRNGTPLPLGEWAIAERFPVARGEYVGRYERLEIPYWRYSREEFVVARDDSTTRRRPGVDLWFGYQSPNKNQPEAILVDFEAGKFTWNRVVSRTEEKTDTKQVFDEQATEALLLHPDGRLMLLEGAEDTKDEARTKRLDAVRKRLRDVRQKSQKGGGKDPKNLFGGG
jgi:hypothetical protein